MAQTRWIRDQGRHRSRNVALFIMAIMCVAKEVSGFVLPTLLVPSPVSETTSIVTTRPRWCARSGRLTPRPQVPIVQMSENHEFHDDSLPSSIETDGATVISLQSTRSSQGSVQQVVEDAAKAVGGSRAVRKVARVLPGTWLTAGLPKWMHTMRRRMITKEDYFHLHAASGLVSDGVSNSSIFNLTTSGTGQQRAQHVLHGSCSTNHTEHIDVTLVNYKLCAGAST